MLNVFISFSRRSDYSLVNKLVEFVNTNNKASYLICAEAKQNAPEGPVEFGNVLVGDSNLSTMSSRESLELAVWYDDLVLGTYGSLDDLTKMVSQADNIVFLISEDFFQSYYCIEELRRAYNNFSDRLTPVVVLVKGCDLESISLSAVQNYWSTLNPEKLNKKWIEGMLRELPLFHSWLLGIKEINTGKFNTSFPMFDESEENVLEKITENLINPRIPHFPIHSESQFFDLYESELAFSFNALSPEDKHSFAQSINARYSEVGTIEEFIVARRTPADVQKLLSNVFAYLSAELRADKPEKILFYGNVRVVVSGLLFSMVDLRALQSQIHAINRSEYATIQIGNTQNKQWQLQFIVACMTKSLALFKLDKGIVAGAGELPVLESGSSKSDIRKRKLTEAVWFDILWKFASNLEILGDEESLELQYKKDSANVNDFNENTYENQNMWSPRVSTLLGHIETHVSEQHKVTNEPLSVYLPVPKDSELDVDIELRNLLHEELPGLPIISMDGNSDLTAQSLLFQDEKIHRIMGGIYGQLQKIHTAIDNLVNRNGLISKDSNT